MYIQIEKDKQKELIKKAVKKSGSYRKLSNVLAIPKSSLAEYSNGRVILESRFDELINFLNIKKESITSKKLEKNWKEVLGGQNCVKAKIKKGTFHKQLKNAQKKGILGIKKWHKSMKKNNPKEYYLMQYEKFKKIGRYKYKTKKGEKVRNFLEKQVADMLYALKLNYEYEPLINIGNKYFYPDFLINNSIIIECTAWKGETKAYRLKEKITYFKKKYKVFVVIPKNLYTYYKILDSYLIKGLDEFVPVAQTFRSS